MNCQESSFRFFFPFICCLAIVGGPAQNLPGQVPVIFSPGIISGPAHDSAPAFTPDGRAVYFSRSNAAGSTILVSQLKGESWSEPQVASFSGAWDDLEPTMAPDGSFLIFVSSRPADNSGKQLDGYFNGRIQTGHGGNLWRVVRSGDRWSDPVRLPDKVNRSTTIYAPSVVSDGSVYFMEASGTQHKFRIFRSQFSEGEYQVPEAVGFSDGEASDVDPAVAPDESFAIFGSARKPALGMDLFFVARRDNKWSEPLHMGTEINSPGSDAEPRLSPNQETVYFSSERVTPISFPRNPASARQDLERMRQWDDGNYNIWKFSLADWRQRNKSTDPASPEDAVRLDASRIKTGRFSYRDTENGKEVGSGDIDIQRVPDSDNYRFSAEFKFASGFEGFEDQRWESIATAALAPVSAKLSFGTISGGSPIFELKYAAGKVSGFRIKHRKPASEVRLSVDDTIPLATVDQRIDWAAVLASPLEVGLRETFNVYDPATGSSRVTVEVGPLERVQVPAGSFEAYRVKYAVHKGEKIETYQVLASLTTPRVMVREEFPDGVVAVLTEMREEH